MEVLYSYFVNISPSSCPDLFAPCSVQGYLAGGIGGDPPPKNMKFPPTLKKAKFFGGREHFPPDQICEFLAKFESQILH